MDKLKMHSPDLTQANMLRLREFFPGCVTEGRVKGEDGKLTYVVDFDLLRQELSDQIVEGPQERYQLNWPGKREALLTANAPIAKTLRPCREESVEFDTTQNLFIEGDNLDALKLLQETYLGKVKMIYIDPPYNTGNDFIYEDDFAEDAEGFLRRSNQKDEEGNRLVANTEANGRFHSDWLSMVYPRLKLARNLLCDDGVIFISIGDDEVSNLRRLCDEVFGEHNLINTFVWNCSTAGGIRPKFASKTHEYVICYAKNIEQIKSFDAPLSSEAIKQYNRKDELGLYREKDFVFKNKSKNVNQKYIITCPDGQKVRPKNGYIYRFIRETFDDAQSKGLVVFKETPNGPLEDLEGNQAAWNIYIKKHLGDATGAPSTMLPKDKIGIYNNGTGTIQELFDGSRVFENTKPPELVQYLATIISDNNCTILDFFAGSSSTAQAVFQLNAEDGGNRRFIMIQIPESCDEESEAFSIGYKTIAELSKERIRRAGQKILSGGCHADWNKDIGFRVLKVDTSNMTEVHYSSDTIGQGQLALFADNIKPDRTPSDLLFQVLLDWGIDLTLPIRQATIQGKTVFFVDENALIACFDSGVDETLVKELAGFAPLRVVFRDNGFVSDAVKINVEQIFKQLSPGTEVKAL